MCDYVQVAPGNWLADSDVARAEFKVYEAAEVAHLPGRLVANVGVHRVIVVWRDNFCGGKDVAEIHKEQKHFK